MWSIESFWSGSADFISLISNLTKNICAKDFHAEWSFVPISSLYESQKWFKKLNKHFNEDLMCATNVAKWKTPNASHTIQQ